MTSSRLNTITLLLMLIRANGVNTISNCGQLTTDRVIPFITMAYGTHHWPWHAALYHQLNDKAAPIYKCGGSLLTSKFILTAAHCVSSNNVPMLAKQVSVCLGKINLAVDKATDQYFEVAEIIIHPDYSSIHYVNDIAIIKVTVDAIFDNYVRPICLWNLDDADLTEVIGKLGTVVGWGLTENDEMSNVLLQASLPVVDTWTCLLSNRDVFGDLITKTNFCAGFQNGTSVCTGDSGGSMAFKYDGIYYIRGIVSVGKSKTNPVTGKLICDPTQFALFTDVAQYIPWIDENTDVCDTNITCVYESVGDHTCKVTLKIGKSPRKCKMIFTETPNDNVTEIKFSGKSLVIPDLSDAIVKFKNLENLTLSLIELRNVEGARLTAFNKIRNLDLSLNNIRELRFDTFDSLENLQGLYLSFNNIWEIHADLFKHLVNLEVIDLVHNQVNTLPANLFRFNKKLREIDLESCALKELDGDIFVELTSLERLHLGSNRLETIPGNIFLNNEKLKVINLVHNYFKELHSDLFKDLYNLEDINLGGNKLEMIQGNIFRNNEKLKKIDLQRNQLTELHSDAFKDLHNLEEIDLEGNKLEMIQGNIFRNNEKLKKIDLQRNQLTELHSDAFKDLHNLEEIDLWDNKLEAIPGNIFRNNQQLQTINLAYNHLKELPATLFKDLNNLERIWLIHNQIEIIPQGIFDTNTKLEIIKLGSNKIKKIEVDFTQFTKLGELLLHGNVCVDSSCGLNESCDSSLNELMEEIQKNCSLH